MKRTHTVSTVTHALGFCLLLAGCGSDFEKDDFVWPVGGTDELRPMSSTFGPRLQHAQNDRYDFHRGIDIPVFLGAPVYSVASGKVLRAGRDPGFNDINVQVEHCRSDGDCIYSTYLHLTLAVVEAGDLVAQGEQVGRSGMSSDSHFPHLHFEIREGSPEQEYSVHPLRFLPTPSWLPPSLTFVSVDTSDPSSVTAEVEVTLPAVTPGLMQVAVKTARRSTGETLEERVFDYDEWNRKYTTDKDPNAADENAHEGIRIAPTEFTQESSAYTLRFRFRALQGTANADDLEITARALDVHGNEAEVSAPESAP
jgi:hypothetical protein